RRGDLLRRHLRRLPLVRRPAHRAALRVRSRPLVHALRLLAAARGAARPPRAAGALRRAQRRHAARGRGAAGLRRGAPAPPGAVGRQEPCGARPPGAGAGPPRPGHAAGRLATAVLLVDGPAPVGGGHGGPQGLRRGVVARPAAEPDGAGGVNARYAVAGWGSGRTITVSATAMISSTGRSATDACLRMASGLEAS